MNIFYFIENVLFVLCGRGILFLTLGLISFIEFYLDMFSYDIVEVKLKPFHLNCSWFFFFFLGPSHTRAIFCLFK